MLYECSPENELSATYNNVRMFIIILLQGCDAYGFGAIFFGCLSMLIHGTVSYSRYKNIVYPHEGKGKFDGYKIELKSNLSKFFVIFSRALEELPIQLRASLLRCGNCFPFCHRYAWITFSLNLIDAHL